MNKDFQRGDAGRPNSNCESNEDIRNSFPDTEPPEPPNDLPMEEPPRRKQKLKTISAVDLISKHLSPTKWVVGQLLPVGLALLVGPPKIGKSWLVLDLAIAVASGSPFMGYPTYKCRVLYISLEDSENRIRSRAMKVGNGAQTPETLRFATEASTLDKNLIGSLEDYMADFPDTGLIIIDTLQKVRGVRYNRESITAYDAREMSILKKFADHYHICVLVVHHTRKEQGYGDVLNMVSGTNELTGAADTILVLSKQDRSNENAVLSMTGRDITQEDFTLKFDIDSSKWECIGRQDDIEKANRLKAYKESPLIRTICHLVDESPDMKWTGTMTQLMEEGWALQATGLADNPRQLSSKIRACEDELFKNDNIRHEKVDNGSTGGEPHKFWRDVSFSEASETSQESSTDL